MLGVHMKHETCADAPGSIILLQEYNHRMLNEYAVAIAGVSLAATAMTSAKSRAALTAARDRLFAIAEMHRALQAPLTGAVEVAGYLETVCSAASQLLTSGRRLVLRCCEQRIVLPAGHAWRIGLIMSELITNAAKHGRPGGDIVVETRMIDQHLVCSVVNERCGLSTRGGGAGKTIVDFLAGHIGGHLERHVDDARIAVRLAVPTGSSIALDTGGAG